jgi:hypothetical protein
MSGDFLRDSSDRDGLKRLVILVLCHDVVNVELQQLRFLVLVLWEAIRDGLLYVDP